MEFPRCDNTNPIHGNVRHEHVTWYDQLLVLFYAFKWRGSLYQCEEIIPRDEERSRSMLDTVWVWATHYLFHVRWCSKYFSRRFRFGIKLAKTRQMPDNDTMRQRHCHIRKDLHVSAHARWGALFFFFCFNFVFLQTHRNEVFFFLYISFVIANVWFQQKRKQQCFVCGAMSQGHFCGAFVHFTVEYYIRVCVFVLQSQ